MEAITSFFSYLFDTNPGPSFRYYIPLLILSGILLVGAIIFGNYYKKRKKIDFAFKNLFKKSSTIAVICGMLILFYIAVRYENIPYFSTRIFIYLIFLLILYFVYRYIKIFKVDYPKEKENIKNNLQTKSEQQVYLPNKKKKK